MQNPATSVELWRFEDQSLARPHLCEANRFRGALPRRKLANMTRILWLPCFVILCAGIGFAQSVANPVPVFVIHRPTIVAFFPHVSDKEMESNPDTNEVLSDFQAYNSEVHDPLQKAGIELRQTDARFFRIRAGKTVRSFQTGKKGVGYYFIAPGKAPHIEYGVMTGDGILTTARKYFGIPIP